MKKCFVALFIAAALLLTACGGNFPHENSAGELQNIDSEMAGTVFSTQHISGPGEGYFVSDIARCGDNFAVLYKTTDGVCACYFFDTDKNSLNKLDNAPEHGVEAISGTNDGDVCFLCIDEDGNYLLHIVSDVREPSTIEIQPKVYEDDIPIDFIAVGSGYIIQTTSFITAVDKQGVLVANIGNYNGLAALFYSGGKPVIAFCEDNRQLDRGGETKLVVLDDNFRTEATYKLDHYYTAFFDLFDGNLLARSGNTIYLINYEKNSREAYIDRLLSGLNETAMLHIGADRFLAKDGGAVKLVFKAEGKGGGVLTLATYGKSFMLNHIVESYNSSGHGYKISLKDYADYDVSTTSNAGLTALNADILSGNGPDILDLSCFSADQLGSKGILEDLKPYFGLSKNISYDMLVPSVVSAFEYKDSLYRFIPFWGIHIMVGDSNITGSQKQWSLEKLAELSRIYSAEELFGSDMTRQDLLRYIAIYGDSYLYDRENQTCHFTDGELSLLLELSKGLPEERKTVSDELSRIYSGEQTLCFRSASYNGILALSCLSAAFDGNEEFIGFPLKDGGRVAAIPEYSFGILTGSNSKDGAWDFFEFLMSDEYLSELSEKDSFSIVDSVFKTQLDKQETLLLAQETPLTLVTANCSIEVNVDPHEIKMALISLVDRIDCAATCDDAVFNIITEAAGPYFAGDKTADDVAAVIQSRIVVYLAEQYA